jgi:hypothetical protein
VGGAVDSGIPVGRDWRLNAEGAAAAVRERSAELASRLGFGELAQITLQIVSADRRCLPTELPDSLSFDEPVHRPPASSYRTGWLVTVSVTGRRDDGEHSLTCDVLVDPVSGDIITVFPPPPIG